MTCAECRRALQRMVDGEACAEAAEALAHVDVCAACASFLEGAKLEDQALRRCFGQVDKVNAANPGKMREVVLARASAATEPRGTPVPLLSHASLGRRLLRAAARDRGRLPLVLSSDSIVTATARCPGRSLTVPHSISANWTATGTAISPSPKPPQVRLPGKTVEGDAEAWMRTIFPWPWGSEQMPIRRYLAHKLWLRHVRWQGAVPIGPLATC